MRGYTRVLHNNNSSSLVFFSLLFLWFLFKNLTTSKYKLITSNTNGVQKEIFFVYIIIVFKGCIRKKKKRETANFPMKSHDDMAIY